MTYTNTGLVAHVKNALADRTKYMWGGIYRPITDAYVEQLAKMYPAHYTSARKQLLKALPDGYYGVDCVGLIKSYYWGGKGSKGYQGATDVNAHGMYNAAKIKGKIATLPEQPGLILYCKTRPHVGIYIGNGEVIESTLSSRGDGVVKSKLKDFGWEYWCQCAYITYEKTAEKPQEKPATVSLKVGDKVMIKDSAATYAGASTNVKIPTRYKGGSNVYTISKVSGEMSLLKELYSWVWNKDLDRK